MFKFNGHFAFLPFPKSNYRKKNCLVMIFKQRKMTNSRASKAILVAGHFKPIFSLTNDKRIKPFCVLCYNRVKKVQYQGGKTLLVFMFPQSSNLKGPKFQNHKQNLRLVHL